MLVTKAHLVKANYIFLDSLPFVFKTAGDGEFSRRNSCFIDLFYAMN